MSYESFENVAPDLKEFSLGVVLRLMLISLVYRVDRDEDPRGGLQSSNAERASAEP